jgi:hypothetical protein
MLHGAGFGAVNKLSQTQSSHACAHMCALQAMHITLHKPYASVRSFVALFLSSFAVTVMCMG